jgi:hypothetical protein
MRQWRAQRAENALERNLVWMVGSPRSGTTWLLNLLRAHPRIKTMDEPLIGAHLGFPASVTVGTVAHSPLVGEASRALDVFAEHDDYFFSNTYEKAWRGPLRRLLLGRLLAQFRDLGGRNGSDFLVVKEPHGSEAADLLVKALPASRLLVVVRDPRDVVDSILDAVRSGSWAADLATLDDAPESRMRFVEDYTRLWLERIKVVFAACRTLPAQQQLLVRYEDLLADPNTGIRSCLDWLGLDVPDATDEHVERLSFKQLGADAKGPGRFARAATPGLWRKNLDAREQDVVNRIARPMLLELGYAED